jgi:hypothetical protein
MADRTRLLYGTFLLVSINALYLYGGTSPFAAGLPSLVQYLAVTAGGILLVAAGTDRVVTLVGDRASPRQYVGTAWLALGLGFLAPAVGDLLAGDGLTLRVGGATLAGGAALLVGVSTLVAPEPAESDDD